MKRRARSIVTLALVAAACRQVAGIDDREVESSSTACGTFEHSSASCGRCTEKSCCEALASCAASLSCAASFACLAACPADDAVDCRSRCRREFPTGFGDELARALACQSRACAFECGLACGGYVAPQATCSSCLADVDCCVAATGCASSEACLSLSFCARGCAADKTCLDDCRLAHPEGEALAAALGTCTADHCDAACGAWSCIGHLPKPKQEGGVLYAFFVKVLDQKGAPRAGVQVRGCPRSDFDCASPVTKTVTTDAGGTAPFMNQVPGGFDGYFEVTGAGLPPTLLFPPSPPRAYTALAAALFDVSELATFAAPLGAPDPTRGHVLAVVLDCTGRPAPGVKLSLTPNDAQATQYYSQQMVATAAATATAEEGLAGFWSLAPAKVFVIDAEVAATGAKLGAFPTWVRAGATSVHWLEPQP